MCIFWSKIIAYLAISSHQCACLHCVHCQVFLPSPFRSRKSRISSSRRVPRTRSHNFSSHLSLLPRHRRHRSSSRVSLIPYFLREGSNITHTCEKAAAGAVNNPGCIFGAHYLPFLSSSCPCLFRSSPI